MMTCAETETSDRLPPLVLLRAPSGDDPTGDGMTLTASQPRPVSIVSDWKSQLIFESKLARIGRFRADKDDAWFRFSGLPGVPCFVFPRATVAITFEGQPSFVAGPNVVTFYNADQIYFRTDVNGEGDHSVWFSLPGEVLAEIVSHESRTAESDHSVTRDAPFPFHWAPCSSRDYLVHRLLVEALTSSEEVLIDEIVVEEISIQLARNSIARALAHRQRQAKRRPPVGERSRELAEKAKELLASTYRKNLTLAQLAEEVGCSAYHLCREFRAVTGHRMSDARRHLRLRNALLTLLESKPDFLSLALDLGYSSHSHFTYDFRRTFGVPPSVVRDLDAKTLKAFLAASLREPGPDPRA